MAMKPNSQQPKKLNMKKNNFIDKFSFYPQSTKFNKSEGNPFKYFIDARKHLKCNSTSLLGYLSKILINF
jgi:hypothetical protein